MSNSCEHINDFYECLNKSGKYDTIVSQKTIGPFGGTRSSYAIPTSGGVVKVRCNFGIDTFRTFNNLDILFVGSVKGHLSSGGGSISSEGSNFSALNISKVDETGKCNVNGIFSNAQIQLPMPMIKQT